MNSVWYARGPIAASGRAALAPIAGIYRAVTGLRNLMYDAGWLRAVPPALPTVSIGNLTVGGTGKTPVAAWMARRLGDAGARPSIVMRGYGDDEPLVHLLLNPDIPVVVNADRVAGVDRALREGSRVAVLDDGFQHRRIARSADVVLLSADRWLDSQRLLPAGPFREGMHSLRRASLVIVTTKAADADCVARVLASAGASAPEVPQAVIALRPHRLIQVGSSGQLPLEALGGTAVLLIAAVGDPGSLVEQMKALGARVTPRLYRDHHRFTSGDISRLAAEATRADLVVCTLKDAVKLGASWPSDAPGLWYVSQEVILQRGHSEIDRLLDNLIEQAMAYPPTMG